MTGIARNATITILLEEMYVIAATLESRLPERALEKLQEGSVDPILETNGNREGRAGAEKMGADLPEHSCI